MTLLLLSCQSKRRLLIVDPYWLVVQQSQNNDIKKIAQKYFYQTYVIKSQEPSVMKEEVQQWLKIKKYRGYIMLSPGLLYMAQELNDQGYKVRVLRSYQGRFVQNTDFFTVNFNHKSLYNEMFKMALSGGHRILFISSSIQDHLAGIDTMGVEMTRYQLDPDDSKALVKLTDNIKTTLSLVPHSMLVLLCEGYNGAIIEHLKDFLPQFQLILSSSFIYGTQVIYIDEGIDLQLRSIDKLSANVDLHWLA